MANNLIRRPAAQVVAPADPLLNTQVAQAERAGMVASARIHSGAFAASTAMHHATMLSQAADGAFRISPLGEDTYRSILRAFGSFATHEIEALGFNRDQD